MATLVAALVLRSAVRASLLLPTITLLDELWSGVPVVAAPGLEAELGSDHRGYTLIVFVVPLIASALLEAAVSLLSDRTSRRRLVVCGLIGLCCALAACALAPAGLALSAGLALAGLASGVACTAAQNELVQAPEGAERAMVRWVLYGAIGDTLTPPLAAAVYALGGSHRAMFAAVAALGVAQAALLAWRFAADRRAAALPSSVDPTQEGALAAPAPDAPRPAAPDAPDAPEPAAPGPAASLLDEPDAPEVPLGAALRDAVGRRALWFWLFGAAMCTLLDEIVVAFAALRMQGDLALSESDAALGTTVLSLGAVLGAWATERLLAHVDSARLLRASAALCLVALVVASTATSLVVIVPCFACVGLAAAPHYALLEARAYAALPERPGVVSALSQLFVVFDVLLPLGVGALADYFGLAVALGALSLQPVTVLALVALAERRSARTG